MPYTVASDSFQPGDIAACYGVDWTSCLIRCGTASVWGPRGLKWPPSHVAVCCRHEGRSLWIESTSLCRHPCLLQSRLIAGVQAQHPEDRIRDYVQSGGRVDLYRLTDVNQLTAGESRLLTDVLIDHFIRRRVRYDVSGALLSATRVLQLTRLFPGADLNRLFCSELVAAVMMRLGRMNHANPTRFHPGRLMRELVRTGKYERAMTFSRSRICRG
ncbi:MAG: hypothetical protein KF861_14590 [Planctomycetaceae bacterium]|nr:hypothetical protein [Planctomycetaceae bacterium]